MHVYKLPSTGYIVPKSKAELPGVLANWAKLEPCQFQCGGKIVRSGECSNHCPPSRGSVTTASEAFADCSGFSEAFPIKQYFKVVVVPDMHGLMRYVA